MEPQSRVSTSTLAELLERHQPLCQNLSEGIADLHPAASCLARQELRAAYRTPALAVGNTLQDQLRRGMISHDIYRRLVSKIDAELRQVE